MRRLRFPLIALGLTLLLFADGVGAQPEEPWEAEVRRAEEEQDGLLEEARRRGTTRQLVGRFAGRVSRQPTALNRYLLARALYYDGDLAASERQLRRVLEMEPRFWRARLRLALLALEQKNPALAERYVVEVLRRRPKEPDALRLMAQLRMDAQDWDRALQMLDALLALEPTDIGVRRNIASVLMAKEDWKRAAQELRILRGRAPRDPVVRYYFATALFEIGELDEAAKEFELLLRLEPNDLAVLDRLRVIYHRKQDWKALEKTLERMEPLVTDAEMKSRIQEVLQELRRGPPQPGTGPAGDPEQWPEDSWLALVERCMHPTDVELRRRSLQAYHRADFPRIPHVLVSRIHWKREPDSTCRSWILRIIGSMQNPRLAQVSAYALYDPDPGVRGIAAETLGELGTPSGILYLMPVLLGRALADPPSPEQVAELNAARHAMITLTERADTLGGADTWVPAESIDAMRKDWLAWLASPDGVHARLRAIEDLETQEDAHPERVLIEDVSDPELSIARAAYLVLLRRSKQPSEDEVAAAMWPRFPRFAPADLTAEGVGRVRQAVGAWWAEWQKMARSASGAPNGE